MNVQTQALLFSLRSLIEVGNKNSLDLSSGRRPTSKSEAFSFLPQGLRSYRGEQNLDFSQNAKVVQLLAARPHDSPLSTLLSRVYGYNYSTSYKYIIFLSFYVVSSTLSRRL